MDGEQEGRRQTRARARCHVVVWAPRLSRCRLPPLLPRPSALSLLSLALSLFSPPSSICFWERMKNGGGAGAAAEMERPGERQRTRREAGGWRAKEGQTAGREEVVGRTGSREAEGEGGDISMYAPSTENGSSGVERSSMFYFTGLQRTPESGQHLTWASSSWEMVGADPSSLGTFTCGSLTGAYLSQ